MEEQDETTVELFAPPAEVRIRIKPEIRIRKVNISNEGSHEWAMLMFVVECGKDSIDMWEAEGSWVGPREGPDWEAFKAFWQSQYDYISRYLGEAILRAGLQLCCETTIAHRSDHPEWRSLLAQWSSEYSKDLEAFDKHAGDAENELDALRKAYPDMPMLQYLVGWFAYAARARLRNTAIMQVGSNEKLRFSDEMIKRYLAIYPDSHKKWSEVCQIIRENRIHWREVLNERCPDLPDDLVAAASTGRYRPSQLARVDAARIAGIGLTAYGNPNAQLTIAQERTIKREIDGYLKDSALTENEDRVNGEC